MLLFYVVDVNRNKEEYQKIGYFQIYIQLVKKMRKNERRIVTFNADPDILKELEIKINSGQRSDFINKALRQAFKLPDVVEMTTNNKRYQNLMEVRDFVSEHKYIDVTHLVSKMSLRLGVTKKKVEEYVDLLVDEQEVFRSSKYIVAKEYYTQLIKDGKPLPGSELWYKDQMKKETKQIELTLNEKEESKVDAFLDSTIETGEEL